MKHIEVKILFLIKKVIGDIDLKKIYYNEFKKEVYKIKIES